MVPPALFGVCPEALAYMMRRVIAKEALSISEERESSSINAMFVEIIYANLVRNKNLKMAVAKIVHLKM